MEYFSTIKRMDNDICRNIDRDYYTKWNIREKYCMTSFICGICKNDTNELIYKTETDSETNLQ